MALNPESALQRHQLRGNLRRLRTESNLTRRSVVERLQWSESKLLRIETGQVGVSRFDLLALLELYGVDDPGETAELVRMAKESRRQPWGDYRDVLHPEFLVYLRYEGIASRLLTYHPLVVPGQLQTRRFARSLVEVFAPPGTPERVIERQVDVRMVRQEILTRDGGPEMSFILDEAAVRRGGGTGPERDEILAEQMYRLRELADHPSITIQVLPFRHGLQFGMNGPFVLLELAALNEKMLYFEGRGSMLVRDDADEVARHERAFSQLARASTAPGDLGAYLDKLES